MVAAPEPQPPLGGRASRSSNGREFSLAARATNWLLVAIVATVIGVIGLTEDGLSTSALGPFAVALASIGVGVGQIVSYRMRNGRTSSRP